MERNNTRLLLSLEQQRRTINRDTINPEICEIGQKELIAIITMVAEARAAYIKSLVALAEQRDGLPSPSQIADLDELRHSFNTLVEATNAMETAIERGYIDVRGPEAA